MNWQIIGYTSLTLVAFIAIFLLVTTIMSSRNMKKQREAVRLIHENLKTGDRVMFAGGIYGTITHIEDDIVKIKVADDVVVKADRFSISGVINK